MNPVSITYEIGDTIYAQPLRLTRAVTYTGQKCWTLTREPADQRDNTEQVSGLSEDNILRMAEAVRNAQGK